MTSYLIVRSLLLVYHCVRRVPVSIRSKLQSIADQLDNVNRTTFEQKTALILDSGIVSEEDMLIALHNQSLSSKLRAAICWILLYFDEDVTVPGLLAVLEGAENDFVVRKAACEVLSFFRDYRAISVYAKLINEDINPEIRQISAYALGQIAHESAVEPLIHRLNALNEIPVVRAQIFESLAYLGAKRAVPTLVEALDDNSVEVRFWATFALGHLGESSEISELERITSDNAMVESWGSVGREASDAIKHIQDRIDLSQE